MGKPRTLADLHAMLDRLGEVAPDDALDIFAFIPVPSASTRHDGWTPERQRDFIAALSRIGVVNAAAKAVGMTAKSAYALRRRAGADSSFDAAWRRALEEGLVMAHGTAIDRAIEGEVEPIFYRGRQVGERRRYNSGLLVAALRYNILRDGG